MKPYKEDLITDNSPFPVDIFISDNRKEQIIAEPHWHECYEILYMLYGTADQQVNDKHFKVEENDIIILNQGDIHCTFCEPSDNTRILVVKFLPEVIGSSFSRLSESRYILAFLNNRSNQICHLQDTSDFSRDIYNLMIGLYDEYTHKEAGYEIFIKGYIYQLIAYLIRNEIINVHDNFTSERDILRLNKLLKHIEANYKDGFTMEEAADMLNMSCSYFSRYFKKLTGKNFKEYIDFVRVCEVEKLILSGDMNISQAAYEAGFCNVSSFNRVFKRVRGYTPKDIKKSKTAKK